MNKEFIKNQLKEAYGLLYDLNNQNKLDYQLRILLQKEVKKVKRSHLSENQMDKLAEKLSNYGNNGSYGKTLLKQLEKQVYIDKKPAIEDLGQWLSVEIECIMPNTDNAEKEFVKYIRSKGYGKYVTIKNDGSIHLDSKDAEHEHDGCNSDYDDDSYCACCDNDCSCGDELGKEIVVTFKYGDWTMITDICKKLNELKFNVNSTCGLHVHFDCRHLKAAAVTKIGKRIANTVPALKRILPKSRQDNHFCQETINKHRGGGYEARYAFVNLKSYSKHRTIEIRGHSGTTDAKKMINWIRILKRVMEVNNKIPITNIPQFVQTFKFEQDLRNYIVERAQKFSSSKQSNGDDVTLDNQAA